MNELNYASLEASKRLVDAGIVLEMEVYHVYDDFASIWMLIHKDEVDDNWKSNEKCPAPSMAEVWRELPETTMLTKVFKDSEDRKEGDAIAWDHTRASHIFFIRTNPTDALIDLLIWVKGRTP